MRHPTGPRRLLVLALLALVGAAWGPRPEPAKGIVANKEPDAGLVLGGQLIRLLDPASGATR